MKNLLTYLRDSIIPPYCYAKACIGKSKTEIKCRYKKADFVELPNDLHSRFEFRICHSTITCDIEHGVCLSATVIRDKDLKHEEKIKYTTYTLNAVSVEETVKREKISMPVQPQAKHNHSI